MHHRHIAPPPMDFARAIAPVTSEVFFSEYFEKRHLIIRRDDPQFYHGLLSVADIDAVLSESMVPADDISMVNTGRPIEPARYTTASGHVDPVRAAQEFAAGGTIILPALHRRLPALAAWCRSLEAVFGCELQTNIYFTPDNAQGFRTHYDMHDVIVLQVHGSKTWKIYRSDLELPLHTQPFEPEGFEPGPVIDEFVLHAGDMCYVPRGLVHDAIATDQVSLHITTGLLAHRWVDLLLEAVAEVAQRDPALRRSVTPGFAARGADDRAGMAAAVAEFADMLARAAAGIEPERTLKRFAADFRSGRTPVVPGQILQHLGADRLAPGTRVQPRPDLIYSLHPGRDEADELVVLEVYGTEIAFPAHVEPSLRDALTRAGAFAVGDLAGDLDGDEQAVLLRRLVREGVMQLLD